MALMKTVIRKAIRLGRMVRASLWDQYSEQINDTFGGECGRAAYLLHKVLPESILIFGSWVADGNTMGCHCWVEYKDYILDPTATQFNKRCRVYAIKKDGPAAKIHYKAEKRGKEAVNYVADWYHPRTWRKDALKHFKRFQKHGQFAKAYNMD